MSSSGLPCAATPPPSAAPTASVVDPRRLPALAEIVGAGVSDEAGQDFDGERDADFDFGLARYLDGVAAYIERGGGH